MDGAMLPRDKDTECDTATPGQEEARNGPPPDPSEDMAPPTLLALDLERRHFSLNICYLFI